jgi:hypothetical protein
MHWQKTTRRKRLELLAVAGQRVVLLEPALAGARFFTQRRGQKTKELVKSLDTTETFAKR